MLKLLVSSTLATFLLCAPALADTPAQPAQQAPISSLRLSLLVKSGTDARTHELVISDHGCGTVKEKAAAYEDDIRVCSRATPSGLVIETDWSTRTGTSEYRTRSEIVMPRKGGTSEIGRARKTHDRSRQSAAQGPGPDRGRSRRRDPTRAEGQLSFAARSHHEPCFQRRVDARTLGARSWSAQTLTRWGRWSRTRYRNPSVQRSRITRRRAIGATR